MDPQSQRRRADIARALGATVVDGPPIVVAGVTYPTWDVYCRDNEQAIAIFDALAHEDPLDDGIRAIAAAFRRAAEGIEGVSVEHEIASQIQSYVQTLRFQAEETETIRAAAVTLALRAGDCDDQAYLAVTLALAAGLDAWIEPLRDGAGDITHAVFAARIDGVPTWFETTVDALPGEHPKIAAMRLGLLSRSDITG